MRALAAAAVVLCATIAHAHFVLSAPTPMYQQGALGDPQKAPPCGADGTEMASGVPVPTYAPGDKVTLTIDEKVFHPGHYRVALGETGPSSLPPEPPIDGGYGYACWTAVIQNPPVYPVLADDLLDHLAQFTSPQTVQVTLPSDKTCTNCTLQVIEFMSAHPLNVPGGCFYHHCVTINIAVPDAGAGAGGGSGASGGGSAEAGGGSANAGGGGGGGATMTDAGTGGLGLGATMGECGCSAGGAASLGVLSLLALALARRRHTREQKVPGRGSV